MKFKEIQPQKRKFNLELNEDELKLLLVVVIAANRGGKSAVVGRFYGQLIDNFKKIDDYDVDNCFTNDFPDEE